MAAVLLGAVLTIVLLPNADQTQALRGIASTNLESRTQAWAWLSSKAPGATRPRVIVMLDDHPDILGQAIAPAGADALRDAAVALLATQGFAPPMVSYETWTPILQALHAGSPDEQSLGAAVEASTLHDRSADVTMPGTNHP